MGEFSLKPSIQITRKKNTFHISILVSLYFCYPQLADIHYQSMNTKKNQEFLGALFTWARSKDLIHVINLVWSVSLVRLINIFNFVTSYSTFNPKEKWVCSLFHGLGIVEENYLSINPKMYSTYSPHTTSMVLVYFLFFSFFS